MTKKLSNLFILLATLIPLLSSAYRGTASLRRTRRSHSISLYCTINNEENVSLIKIDPIRFASYTALSVLLALGANFMGMTSSILSESPMSLRTEYSVVGLDQIYPISGFKKFTNQESKYEYLYPDAWLADQTVLLANVRTREIPEDIKSRRMTRSGPDSAFGPMGSDGRVNLSVIKSNIMPGFSLRGTLGAPEKAASILLSTVIAPPGSGKETNLISATEDVRNGIPVYVFEYTVKKGNTFFQHAISVIIAKREELVTFTAVAPEAKWGEFSQMLTKSASSFRLT